LTMDPNLLGYATVSIRLPWFINPLRKKALERNHGASVQSFNHLCAHMTNCSVFGIGFSLPSVGCK
uniref:WS_DGAT_C domain-containing protein n=1 Tax=Echinostoma caproni TaxID=27848 RepID=A0A183AFM4_9TREM